MYHYSGSYSWFAMILNDEESQLYYSRWIQLPYDSVTNTWAAMQVLRIGGLSSFMDSDWC